MDFTKRREAQKALTRCLFTAKLIISAWEADRSMNCPASYVKALREIIQRLRDSVSLKLWYPLPHLNK